jgi:hypothetical protein
LVGAALMTVDVCGWRAAAAAYRLPMSRGVLLDMASWRGNEKPAPIGTEHGRADRSRAGGGAEFKALVVLHPLPAPGQTIELERGRVSQRLLVGVEYEVWPAFG